MIQKLIVPGQPRGKQRPRTTRHGHVYTPKETREYEKQIKRIALSEGIKKAQGKVALSVIAFRAAPKAKQNLIGQYCTVKPDIDNILKIVLDGLCEVAYHDDKQVVDIYAQKFWAKSGSVYIQIADVYDEDDNG